MPNYSIEKEEAVSIKAQSERWRRLETFDGDAEISLIGIRDKIQKAYNDRKKNWPKSILDAYKKSDSAEVESKPMLRFSAAPCYIDPTGTGDKYSWNGYGAWVSYSVGKVSDKDKGMFDEKDSSQLIFHVRVRQGERFTSETGSGKRNTSLLGARYRIGGPDVKFSLEIAEAQTQQTGKGTKKDHIVGVVFEPRIAPGIWSSISLAKDTRNGSSVGLKTSFRYGFN
jgi:hypothetical protein